MKTLNTLGAALGLIGTLTLGACATTDNQPNYAVSDSSHPYSRYGVVQSIDYTTHDDNHIGLGTLAGAVVGGVVGHQIGSGGGNTAATVIGAGGGAYVGHEMEKQNRQNSDGYKITVRMEDGSYQSLTQGNNPNFRVGDQVRITNGVMERN
jgi:outer membrane lipoprotein SlyB